MNLSASTAHSPALAAPAPALGPTGVGDWFDSSLELQRGVLVTEWHLPAWDEALMALAAPPVTH